MSGADNRLSRSSTLASSICRRMAADHPLWVSCGEARYLRYARPFGILMVLIAGMAAALLLAGDADQEGRVLVRQVAGWFPARPREGGDRAWRNQVEAVEERGEF